jgi:hypothetical protein
MRDTALRKQAAAWHFCPSSGVREVMRSEILRDVIAGCAGVLAVAALIGLPPSRAGDLQQYQSRPAQLLPYVHFARPKLPDLPAPRENITTRP